MQFVDSWVWFDLFLMVTGSIDLDFRPCLRLQLSQRVLEQHLRELLSLLHLESISGTLKIAQMSPIHAFARFRFSFPGFARGFSSHRPLHGVVGPLRLLGIAR